MTDDPADRADPSQQREASLEALEQSFVSLFRFVKANQRAAAANLDPSLQPAAWHLLRQVVRDAPVQVGSLVHSTGMDKSSVSRLLRDLRERGLVEAEQSPEDARAVIIRPSIDAAERLKAAAKENRERYRSYLATWTDDELAEFSQLLAKFTEIERWDSGDSPADPDAGDPGNDIEPKTTGRL